MNRNAESARYKADYTVARQRIAALCKTHLAVIETVYYNALHCLVRVFFYAFILSLLCLIGYYILYRIYALWYFRLYYAVKLVFKLCREF